MKPKLKHRSVCILWKWEEALYWEGKIPSGGDGRLSGGLPVGTTAFIWAVKDADLHLMGAFRVTSSGSHQMRGKSLYGLFRLIALRSEKWTLRFDGTRDRLRKSVDLGMQVRARRWLAEESAVKLHRILAVSSTEDRSASDAESIWEKKYTERSALTRVSNPALRNMALAKYGPICQVCDLDFAAKYGSFAKYCIEIHHLTPRSKTKEGVSTGIADVAILCPNCHRAFHRWQAKSSYGQFRKFIRAHMNL